MRFLVPALLLLPASAGAVSLQTAPGRDLQIVRGETWLSAQHCPRTTRYYAYKPGEPVKPLKLGELPPANAYAAVLRHRNGCEVPLIVKYRVGGG